MPHTLALKWQGGYLVEFGGCIVHNISSFKQQAIKTREGAVQSDGTVFKFKNVLYKRNDAVKLNNRGWKQIVK